MTSSPEAINAGIAARVARLVAGPGPEVSSAEIAGLKRDFAEFTERADAAVRSFTGIEPPAVTEPPRVVARSSWVRLNLATFERMLEPLADKIGAAGGLGRRVGSAMVGAQTGLVLGYLAKKVLGQYDLFLASESGGVVYFVGPNIVEAERRERLDPRDFRYWIALHEVTHRTQFEGVPWLREYVREQIAAYLAGAELDADRLKEAAGRVKDLLRSGPGAINRDSIIRLLLTPQQHEVLERMQSLMCVVEGHGNFVMNRVGEETIESYRSLKGAFEQRREQAGAGQRAFEKMLGIDMKLQQYSLGEAFVARVAGEAGMAAVNRLWDGREALPSMDEIREPAAWLDRMGA